MIAWLAAHRLGGVIRRPRTVTVAPSWSEAGAAPSTHRPLAVSRNTQPSAVWILPDSVNETRGSCGFSGSIGPLVGPPTGGGLTGPGPPGAGGVVVAVAGSGTEGDSDGESAE